MSERKRNKFVVSKALINFVFAAVFFIFFESGHEGHEGHLSLRISDFY